MYAHNTIDENIKIYFTDKVYNREVKEPLKTKV